MKKRNDMKRYIFFITVFICIFGSQISASELTKVVRVDNKGTIQLYFSFKDTPAFSTTDNERRINLIFEQTEPVSDLKLFEADSRIVKILSRSTGGGFVLSLFFRYKPQNYKLSKSIDDKIVFEVLLGNQYTKSYTDLTDRLKGLTVLDRNSIDFSNPYVLSPYVKDWMSFFSKYEAPVKIELPVQFSPPPFPLIRLLPPGKDSNMQIFTPEMLALADKGRWIILADQILAALQSETNFELQKMLALTYGEVLARGNDFVGAFKQLYLLNEQFSEEHTGIFARYLLNFLQAVHDNPYIANFEYKSLEESVSASNPLAPYLLLSQIETALAASQYPQMNKLLLRDDVALPAEVSKIREIRQADYWFAIKQPIKAYASYKLLSQSEQLYTQPYSLNGYCATLYIQKKFRKSAGCYDQLSSLPSAADSLGLIQYRANMARLKFQNGTSLASKFSKTGATYHGTEAGYRSTLKKIDLLLLEDKTRLEWALESYKDIAEKSVLRVTTEEALLKQAIIYAQMKQNDKSIALLQKLLREFRYGSIRKSAQALLIGLFPEELKRLVDQGEYLKALVLAKQNRELFQKNWVSSRYIEEIAEAYYKIGIYNEAQRLYLYLIKIVPVDKKEQYFLPMINALFNYGNYTLVDNYSAQYTYNYPQGKFSQDILFLRIQALVADDRLEDALRLLPSPLPDNVEVYRFAASLFYLTNNYERCVSALGKLTESTITLSQQEIVMYGESLIKTGNVDDAEGYLRQVTRENPFFDQSLYRLAEIEKRKGNEKNALRLFTKIVETGTSERWKLFASKELEFADAAASM